MARKTADKIATRSIVTNLYDLKTKSVIFGIDNTMSLADIICIMIKLIALRLPNLKEPVSI